MKRIVPWVAAGALGVLSIAVMHRGVILSGFRSLPGDQLDARWIVAIIEHWYRFYLGQQRWLTVPYFHPVANTLGYSDSLFLYSIPYTPLRLAGADPFRAFQIVLMFWSAIGFSGMLLLCRRGLSMPVAFSAVGAAIFTLSNGQFLHVGHSQNFGVMLAPWEAFLLLDYWRLPDKLSRRGWFSGMALAVLVPLHLYTSYYFGWAFIFFACLGAALVLAQNVRISGHRAVLEALGHAWVSQRRQWLSFGIVAAVFLAPFFATYVPVLLEMPARSYAEVRSMLPEPVDLINVSTGNLVWGRLLTSVLAPLRSRAMSWELNYGFPPLLLLLFVMSTAAFMRKGSASGLPRATAANRSGLGLSSKQWIFLFGGIVLLGWLLLLKVGENSLWWLVYQLVPGAKALRAVSRLQLVLLIPMIAVVMLGLARAWDWARRERGWHPGALSVALAFILAFLLVEQLNGRHNLHWDRVAQLDYLARVQPVPPDCRAFFLAPSSDRVAGTPFQMHYRALQFQTEAMQLANHAGIPTFHGYGGFFPRDYSLLDPEHPDYLVRVNSWLRLNVIREGVCSYNPLDGSWTPYQPPG